MKEFFVTGAVYLPIYVAGVAVVEAFTPDHLFLMGWITLSVAQFAYAIVEVVRKTA